MVPVVSAAVFRVFAVTALPKSTNARVIEALLLLTEGGARPSMTFAKVVTVAVAHQVS